MSTRDSDHFSASIRPPRWAEALLHVLLAADEAETVSGDLIEEYRETVYPSRGRWRADLWFVRQVSSFAWRGNLIWGVLLALGFLVHPTVMLGIWQPRGWPPRPSWQPNGIVLELAVMVITVFLLAARSAWRTGHVRSGMIVAVSVGVVGSVVFFAGSIFEIAFLLRGGNVLQARKLLIMIPYVTLSLAVLFGTAGALIGKVLRIAVLPRRTI
jgi:hypothetical protein